MAGSNALERTEDVAESKYWDIRNPSTYHVDPDCPIGRWIPGESVQWGTMTAARGCEACATVREPPVQQVRGSYLFAI